jgi:metal-responsive CopG/Arc/MetJ family transcriptional regulator
MLKPIQILMDERLIGALDREARRLKSDRSKLIRVAVTRLLSTARRRSLEEQDRACYERTPQAPSEWEPWQEVQSWPEE